MNWPDVTVTLTLREAKAIQTLCRMQADKYGLTEGYPPVDVAKKLGIALRDSVPSHGDAT